MRSFIVAVIVSAVTGLSAGNAGAVGAGKKFEYSGNSQGAVVFDGQAHKDADLVCSDCHNPGMFPAMKKGTVKITMNDLYAGKYCGRCHDGKKAFMIKDNCTRCHREPGRK